MKKIFLFLFLLCSFACTEAQTFSFSGTDTIRYGTPGNQFACTDSFVNNSSTGFYVDVIRMLNDTAHNWSTSYCLDVCYPPSTDSAQFYLLPNSSQSFILDFYTDTIPDTSTVLMKFKNVMNPSNVVYKKFYGITLAGLGTNNLSSSEMNVKVFPSPVIAENTFCFRISGNENTGKDFTLMVYDVCGKTSSRIENLIQGDNYLSLNLPEGFYVYNLIHNNSCVKTGKIAVGK